MSVQDWVEKDYYKVLGVDKTASADEIKKAYRKLARDLHPDRNQDNHAAEERFKDVSEAYDVLSDKKKRAEYDETRDMFASGRGGGGFRFPGGTGAGGGTGGVPFDLSDLFGQGGTGGGGVGDLFGTIFSSGRGGRAPGTGPRRGADVESEVTIGFRESVDGVTVPLRMTSEAACDSCHGTGAKAGTVPRVCPTCEGTGQATRSAGRFGIAEPCRECRGRGLVVDDPCPTCHGSGRGKKSRTMNVRVPAGVRDGQRIKLKGKGAPGERGGAAGDLYLTVHVTPDQVFGRSGDNLTITVPVTFTEAALGSEIEVPTLGGSTVRLKLPAGTPNGRTMRVRGKGSTRQDGTKGDLLVTIEVQVPQRVDGKAKEALEQFADATAGEDVRADLIARAHGGAR
jgi:molecular chaperone DnaJ